MIETVKERFNSYIIRHSEDTSSAYCPKCQKDKPINEYYVHSLRGDGAIRYRSYCKSCRRKRERKQHIRPVYTKILETQLQTCKFCKVEKSLDCFYSNGCFSDGTKKYRTRCKDCVLKKAKKNQTVSYKTKSEKRSSSPKNFISGILNHATKRKQHLGFNIDLIYLLNLYEKQNGLCAISGVNMTYLAGKGRVFTNVSIDRIDSNKGYLRGNVQFVCDIVNIMKSNMSHEELLFWCKSILNNLNGKEI